MFPRKEADNKNDFRIYSCHANSPNVLLNSYGNLSIKGVMQRLELGVEYEAQIELEKVDAKYGASYSVLSIYQEVPETMEGQKAFLATLMTELQLKEVYKTYPNEDIVKLIIDDKFEYEKVKQFGSKTYKRIRDRILENIAYRDILSRLGKYGITYDIILKLEKTFGSKELAIQKIEENPYELTQLSGFGFKRADKIAQLMGFKKDDPHRIKYGIRFTIDDNQQQGHTYMLRDELLRNASEKLELTEVVVEDYLNDTDGLVFIDDKVSLTRTYNAEKHIAKRLFEILSSSKELDFDPEKYIDEIEKKYKTKFTNQQKKFFYDIKNNPVNLLVGYAGCVDKDTEFFDGYGWKRICDFRHGDRVLQYNDDGSSELVYPSKYIVLPEEKLTLIKTDRGSINQCLSDEHNVVYNTSKGNLANIEFKELKRRHEINECGFNGRFMTTFRYSGCGINLKDEEIRLMVAIIADGNFVKGINTNRCRINIKKQRKKDRLVQILNECKVDHKVKNRNDGFSSYTFYAPMKAKKFDSFWYNCNENQIKVIADEVLHWDGNSINGRERFSTTEKESADFVQFVFSSIGKRSTIAINDRSGEEYKCSKNGIDKYYRRSKEYIVNISQGKSEVSLISRSRNTKTEFKEYRTLDGLKYCFTVPSGMWIMRREGRIAVTGNCGKSYLQKFLVDLLNKLGLTYVLLSPSAKAAKVTRTYTGVNAQTIHRRIGFGMDKEEEMMLEIHEDFVIIDESGMTDVFILSSLLSKIKNPNTRVLFVGDDFQLLSVQAGNFLHDAIESGVIPMTKLDIVFRQGDGGILDVATKIREGKQIVGNDFEGKQLFGKDFLLHCVDQVQIEKGYKHYYNLLLNTYKPEDIMVLSPTKKGKLGTIELNKYIQEQVNPFDSTKKQHEYGYDGLIRVGDYILNTVNMYQIANMSEEGIDVVNGDSGKVIDIKTEDDKRNGDDELAESEKKGIIIQFDDQLVRLDIGLAAQLLSAWALTIHKSQGSSSEATLIVVDRSNKFQISANLIYTAITRSVSRCIFLTQAETLNFAIRKVESKRRNTHLCRLLQEKN